MYMCVCVYTCMEARGQFRLSPSVALILELRSWSSLLRLGWLVLELWGFICLCLPHKCWGYRGCGPVFMRMLRVWTRLSVFALSEPSLQLFCDFFLVFQKRCLTWWHKQITSQAKSFSSIQNLNNCFCIFDTVELDVRCVSPFALL